MLETWFLTVFSEIERSRAICLLPRPRAKAGTVSSSRRVRGVPGYRVGAAATGEGGYDVQLAPGEGGSPGLLGVGLLEGEEHLAGYLGGPHGAARTVATW